MKGLYKINEATYINLDNVNFITVAESVAYMDKFCVTFSFGEKPVNLGIYGHVLKDGFEKKEDAEQWIKIALL